MCILLVKCWRGSSAYHWDELLALVQGVVGVHEDALSLRLKVLLSLLGTHGGVLVWQQPVPHVLYAGSPAHAPHWLVSASQARLGKPT